MARSTTERFRAGSVAGDISQANKGQQADIFRRTAIDFLDPEIKATLVRSQGRLHSMGMRKGEEVTAFGTANPWIHEQANLSTKRPKRRIRTFQPIVHESGNTFSRLGGSLQSTPLGSPGLKPVPKLTKKMLPPSTGKHSKRRSRSLVVAR